MYCCERQRAPLHDQMTNLQTKERKNSVSFQHGIILNVIGVVGLAGNAIVLAILSRPRMRNSTNLILCALATFDVVVIITSMLMLR